MSVKFDVQMTAKAMYNFMVHHTYTQFSGILSVIFGIVSVVFAVARVSAGNVEGSLIFFVFGALFIVYTPVNLWFRSKKQVKMTPSFQKPITYELTESGVIVSQEDQSTENKWEDFVKAVSTGQVLVLYITRVRAIIFPKEQLGEQYTAVVQMISTHMPPDKVKIRQVN